MNVDKLNITNVTHRESSYFINVFYIRFEIEGFGYSMFMERAADGLVYPRYIEHLHEYGKCKYCKFRSELCVELKDYKKELFHRLIEFSSIRLEWLYIDHI